MSALQSWTPWREARVREVRPVSADDIAYSEPMWRQEWAAEIQQAAERREEIPMTVVRSYARYIGEGAARNLRAAANAEAIASALRPKPEEAR